MYFLQEKESLITELRKELRLSNEEHRELLGRVNADDVIRRIRSDKIVKQGFLLVYLCFRNEFVMTFHVCTVIMLLINALLDNDNREWRQAGGHQPGVLSTGQGLHDSIPSPTVSASRKKQKITPSVPPSRSFGGPSPPFHPQTLTAPHQPSSAAKRGSAPGSKGKKHKPVSWLYIYFGVLFFSLFICSLNLGLASLLCFVLSFPGSNITWCLFNEAVSFIRTRWKESSI